MGAKLPQDEVGLGIDNGTIETLDHVVNFFAIYATIDHSDLAIWEMPLKLNGQTARISCAGCARACAQGATRGGPAEAYSMADRMPPQRVRRAPTMALPG